MFSSRGRKRTIPPLSNFKGTDRAKGQVALIILTHVACVLNLLALRLSDTGA